MVKIRRLTTRLAPGRFWRFGQVDEVPVEEARRAIRAGTAELLEGDLGDQLETTRVGAYETAARFGIPRPGHRPSGSE